jgi:hypothetical protein
VRQKPQAVADQKGKTRGWTWTTWQGGSGISGTIDDLRDWSAGLVDKGRDQAKELEGCNTGVAKLMELIRGDVKHIARLQGLLAAIAVDDAFAGEDEDFVFVIVLVFGGATAGGDDELPHGERRTAVVGPAEELHLDVLSAGHGDGLGGDGINLFVNHGGIIPAGSRTENRAEAVVRSKRKGANDQQCQRVLHIARCGR